MFNRNYPIMFAFASILTVFCLGCYRVLFTEGTSVLTDPELNACAEVRALKDFVEYGPHDPDVASAFLLQYPRGDVLAQAKAYEAEFGTGAPETVMQRYVRLARPGCTLSKLFGRPVAAPSLTVRAGYHITRWNGSAALVKDGDPEPTFTCSPGYVPNGEGCFLAVRR